MNATKQNVATPNRTKVRSIKNLTVRETISMTVFYMLSYMFMVWFVLGGVSALIDFYEPEAGFIVDLPLFLVGLAVLVIASWRVSAYMHKQSDLIKHFHKEVMTGMIVETPVMNTTYSILMLTVVVEGLNRAGNIVREDIPIDAEKWREGEYIIGQQFIRPDELKLAD